MRLAFDTQRHLAADHHGGQALLGDVPGDHLANSLTAAHDSDAVGDRQHLRQLVGDEDDGAALLDQCADRREQLGHLLRREHCGRLVEDKDARVAVERLQDLDALLLADRQLPDRRQRIYMQAKSRESALTSSIAFLRSKRIPERGSDPSTTFS